MWLSNSRQHCFFQRSVHGKDRALNTSTYSQQNRVHCNNLYLPPMGLHASHLHSCTIATAYIVHHYARQVSHNVDHAQPKLSGLFAPLTTALQRGSYYETALRQTTALPIHLWPHVRLVHISALQGRRIVSEAVAKYTDPLSMQSALTSQQSNTAKVASIRQKKKKKSIVIATCYSTKKSLAETWRMRPHLNMTDKPFATSVSTRAAVNEASMQDCQMNARWTSVPT